MSSASASHACGYGSSKSLSGRRLSAARTRAIPSAVLLRPLNDSRDAIARLRRGTGYAWVLTGGSMISSPGKIRSGLPDRSAERLTAMTRSQ
jgi:hypothetical protein